MNATPLFRLNVSGLVLITLSKSHVINAKHAKLSHIRQATEYAKTYEREMYKAYSFMLACASLHMNEGQDLAEFADESGWVTFYGNPLTEAAPSEVPQ